jgi:hypothetical protein
MLLPQQLLLATQALYEPHTSLTRASQEHYTILKQKVVVLTYSTLMQGLIYDTVM